MIPEPAGSPLRIALGEYDTGWHDPDRSLDRAAGVIARAAAAGAQLVALPEMAATGFTMACAEWAEPLDGPSARRLAGLAREHGVYVLAGLATRPEGNSGGACYNSAVLWDPSGAQVAEYRKQRLFAYAGEDASYAAGAERPGVIRVGGVRLAALICYDLRFPELFRAVAPEVDAIVLIANWPASRRSHWEALLPARAIENQCYIVAVNRTGEGGGLEYHGGSVAYGPWGERVAPIEDDPQIVEIDPAEVTRVRAAFPFSEDRRS